VDRPAEPASRGPAAAEPLTGGAVAGPGAPVPADRPAPAAVGPLPGDGAAPAADHPDPVTDRCTTGRESSPEAEAEAEPEADLEPEPEPAPGPPLTGGGPAGPAADTPETGLAAFVIFCATEGG
jgi:hypothetical protein